MVSAPREVSVLGPIEVPGLSVAARRVLAVLAFRSGALARTEEIADALWGEVPPASWRKSLQNHVVRLRRALGADAITTEPGGYRLLLSTDVARFQRLARTDPERALDMWRGDPWPELEDWPVVAAARASILESRWSAEELAAELRLDAGRAQRLVDEHPLRERRWCILLMSLQAEGRQAEALRAAQRARAMFREELGMEPGPELRRVETSIARGDMVSAPPSTVVTPEQARALGEEAHAREDFMLALQWLRVAGDTTNARLSLGASAFAAGDATLGLDAVTDVVRRAVASGDAATAVDAVVCLTAARGVSLMTPAVQRIFDDVQELVPVFDVEQRTQVAACAVLARAHNTGRDDLREMISAIDVGAGASPTTRTLVWMARLLALDRPHDAQARLEMSSEVAPCDHPELARRAAWLGRHARLWALLELGHPDHRRVRDELVAAVGATSHAVDRANGAMWAASGVLDGDVARSEREAIEWLGPLASREGVGVAALVHGAFLFTVRWMQGRLPELIPNLEAAARAMPDLATWRSALAMAYAADGRHRDAEDLLHEFFDGGGIRLDVGYGLWSATMFHLVEAAVACGSDAGASLIDELTPIADRHAFYVSHHLGSFHHHLGELERVAGRIDVARAHFVAASAAHEALGSKWWTARSRARLAAT